MGEYDLDSEELGLVDEGELTEKLVGLFHQKNYSPPRLPAVAMELVALSQKPNVDFDQIHSLLENDAVLAGELLGIARSAFYSGSRQVTSLQEALVRLGLEKLRDITLQAAMNLRVFRSKAYADCKEQLRRHSYATAHLSRIVCRYTPMPEDQAFLCGLLHDVGFAGIFLALADVPRGQQAPDLSLLWPAIHGAHAQAAARMVQLWNLPPDVSLTVNLHHQVRSEGFDHPIAAIVCLAEALAGEIDMALIPAQAKGAAKVPTGLFNLGNYCHVDQSDAATLKRAETALGLSESQMHAVRDDARAWAKAAAEPALAGAGAR